MPSIQRSIWPAGLARRRNQGPKPIQFDFLACSDARLIRIFEDEDSNSGGGRGRKPGKSQASLLKNRNPDLVTMSIGGKDVGFVDLLDRVSQHSSSVLNFELANLPSSVFTDFTSPTRVKVVTGCGLTIARKTAKAQLTRLPKISMEKTLRMT